MPLAPASVAAETAPASPAQPQPALAAPASATEEVRRRVAALAGAVARRDVKALLAFYAPAYDDVEPEGRHLTRDDVARAAAALRKTAPSSGESTTVLSIDVEGTQATVVSLHYTRAVRSLDDGTMARTEVASRDRDRWTLIDGTWYVDRSVVESRDLYVDGVLSEHTGAGEPVDP